MSEDKLGKQVETKEKPVETVSVIIIKDGNLLTVRHRAGTTAGEGVTGLPGGRIRESETQKDAAVRELYEETGIKTDVEDLIEFPDNFFEAELDFLGNVKTATMTVFIRNKWSGELIKESIKTKPEWTLLSKIKGGFYETLPNILEAIQNADKFLNEQN